MAKADIGDFSCTEDMRRSPELMQQEHIHLACEGSGSFLSEKGKAEVLAGIKHISEVRGLCQSIPAKGVTRKTHTQDAESLANTVFSAFQQKALQQLPSDILPEQLKITLLDERSGESRKAKVAGWQQLESWLNNLIAEYPDLPNRGEGKLKSCNGNHCEFIPYLIHNTVFITDLIFTNQQGKVQLLEIRLVQA